MRGLTLTQPWATLVAKGHKRVETRSWTTHYRGMVAIHAAKGFPEFARDFAFVQRSLGRIPDRIARGAIVAVGQLVAVRPTSEASLVISALERSLGDYSPGRFAWLLEDVRALKIPVACRGALSLWTLPEDVARVVAYQLGST